MTMAEGDLAVAEIHFVRKSVVEPLPPPRATTGAIGWLRANLFSSVFNGVLTAIVVIIVAWALKEALSFLLIDAVFTGADRAACLVTPQHPDPGACWPFV